MGHLLPRGVHVSGFFHARLLPSTGAFSDKERRGQGTWRVSPRLLFISPPPLTRHAPFFALIYSNPYPQSFNIIFVFGSCVLILNTLLDYSVELNGIASLVSFLSAIIWLRRQESIRLGHQVSTSRRSRRVVTALGKRERESDRSHS